MKKGKIFILSGQSGIGKNTLLNMLLDKYPYWQKIVTCTTRIPIRAGEINGIDHIFIGKDRFMEMIEDDEFVEYAKVHSFYYGTPKQAFVRALRDGGISLMEIDVQGTEIIRKEFPEVKTVFIQFEPGKLEEQVRRRLLNDPKRQNISEEDIQSRIQSAKKEAEYIKHYDYVVTNPEGHPEKAIEEIEEIIGKELRSKKKE